MPHPLTKPLVDRIADLKSRGDVGELKRVLEGLNEALALPKESYESLVSEAEANRQQLVARLPREIRDAAGARQLEFKASPPFYRLGCFSLRQKDKKPDLWDVSALDNVVIASLQAQSGQELVDVVSGHVTNIEAVLKQLKVFAKDLRANYELLADALPNAERVSPNLLLLLMNVKNARRVAASGELEPARPVSRAAFGYALAALQKEPEGGQAWELKPATQLETAKPNTFVSVPVGSLNPRVLSDSRPIASLRLSS